MDIKQVMAGRQQPPQKLNLINPTRVDSADFTAAPPGFYQSFVLDALGIIAAFFVGYAYDRYLTAGLSFWVPLAVTLPFVACSILHAFLTKKTSRRMIFLLLETVAVFLPFVAFVFLRGWLFVIAAAIFFLFLLWGYLESRSEMNYGTEIRFFKMSHAVAAKLVTAMLLFGIFILVILRGLGGNFFVSENTFTGFFDGSAAFFNDFYPDITVTSSFQDFASSIAQQQLASSAAFHALSPGDQTAALQEAAATLTTNFSRTLGVPIASSSTMSDVIYNFIVTTFHNWHDRFGTWFVVAWAFALFIVLRGFGVVFILIAQFFGMILYEILLGTGMVRVVEHPQTKEVVEFS